MNNVDKRNRVVSAARKISRKFPIISHYIENMAYVGGSGFKCKNNDNIVGIQSLLMGKTPVTWGMWNECADILAILPDHPDYAYEKNHPVVNVSALDCELFCNWLSKESGIFFRLPSSSEFEYVACQADRTRKYPWGNNWDRSKVWGSVAPDKVHGTASVARKKNIYTDKLGISDMAGNVWQWCSDGHNEDRFFMGGSWDSYIEYYFRCAYVGSSWQRSTHTNFGFRLVTIC